MDEYSKSGPKTARAASRERERESLRLLQKLLELESERDFIEELRKQLDITPRHAAYEPAIKIWREKHSGR